MTPPALFKTILTATSLLCSSIVMANQVKEFSLERKVDESDTVFIGRVVSIKTESVNGIPGNEYSLVHIQSSLKGRASGTVSLLSKGDIAESDPQCCEVGANYLFFLTNIKDDVYESTNGPFGVYKLPKE